VVGALVRRTLASVGGPWLPRIGAPIRVSGNLAGGTHHAFRARDRASAYSTI